MSRISIDLIRGALGVALLLGTALAAAADAPPNPRVVVGDPVAGRAWSDDNVCKECHNPDGNSTVPEYPRLGGQFSPYLLKQLQDWKAGIRSNSPDGIMNSIARALGDADIEALADYLSGL